MLQELEKKRKRRHGCEFPWSVQFLFSWIFVSCSGPFYYIIYDPFFSLLELRIVLTFFTSVLWTSLIVCGIILVFSDPSDVRIYLVSENIKPVSENTRYCLVCKVNVHSDSLHCKYCNKCVYRLDHHCFYVNNCIGKSNYTIYIAAMILTTVFSLWNSCISFYVISTYVLEPGFFSRIKQEYHFDSDAGILSIIIIFTLLSCMVWMYLTWLLQFHYVLWRHGMTSLEYTRSKKISATLE